MEELEILKLKYQNKVIEMEEQLNKLIEDEYHMNIELKLLYINHQEYSKRLSELHKRQDTYEKNNTLHKEYIIKMLFSYAFIPLIMAIILPNIFMNSPSILSSLSVFMALEATGLLLLPIYRKKLKYLDENAKKTVPTEVMEKAENDIRIVNKRINEKQRILNKIKLEEDETKKELSLLMANKELLDNIEKFLNTKESKKEVDILINYGNEVYMNLVRKKDSK